MEFIVQPDGFLTEHSAHELAAWYSGGDSAEDFEAHLLLLMAHAALTSSAQRGRRTQLSRERFSLLRSLYRAPDRRMQMGDAGRVLNVSPTSITKLVAGLANAGLVRRLPHASDKRRAWIELTADGALLVEESLPNVRRATRQRWQSLTTDEKRMLVHLLCKVVLGQEAHTSEARLASLRPEWTSVNGAAGGDPAP